MFYKAAFYDRDAFINIHQRFVTKTQPVGGYANYDPSKPMLDVSVVLDEGKVIWQSEPVEIPKGGWEIAENLRGQGIAWLNERYPEWQDEFAYWDNTHPSPARGGVQPQGRR